MTSAWSTSWGSSWGPSWGKTAIADAVEKSGVQRLWMYELYEQTIKEDEEKRNQNNSSVQSAETHSVNSSQKKIRKKRRTVRHAPPPARPLPTLPPVFTFNVAEAILQERIFSAIDAAIRSPLPVLSVRTKRIKEGTVGGTAIAKVDAKPSSIEEEELLILLSA